MDSKTVEVKMIKPPRAMPGIEVDERIGAVRNRAAMRATMSKNNWLS
jgi:hypothetical protein